MTHHRHGGAMGRGPGYKGVGWLWHREAGGMLWHRAYQRVAACGAEVRGLGQSDAPPPADEVCEACAKATRFRRRRQVATISVRVPLPARDVRAVRRAGMDPAVLLRGWWREGVDALRPLADAGPVEGTREADALQEARWALRDAAGRLLGDWAGKGVPIRALMRATRLPRRTIHAVCGQGASPMRFPGALGIHRAYPAAQLRDRLGVTEGSDDTSAGGEA